MSPATSGRLGSGRERRSVALATAAVTLEDISVIAPFKNGVLGLRRGRRSGREGSSGLGALPPDVALGVLAARQRPIRRELQSLRHRILVQRLGPGSLGARLSGCSQAVDMVGERS